LLFKNAARGSRSIHGTGEKKLDSEDQIEGETEVRSAGSAFVVTSESDLEEKYSVHQQQHHLSLN